MLRLRSLLRCTLHRLRSRCPAPRQAAPPAPLPRHRPWELRRVQSGGSTPPQGGAHSFITAVSIRPCDRLPVLSWEPVASATQHADVAQGHLLVFSPEAQPISEPGFGGACLDVGLTVLSRGEGGSLLAPGLPSQPFPVRCFKQCHVPCSTTSL